MQKQKIFLNLSLHQVTKFENPDNFATTGKLPFARYDCYQSSVFELDNLRTTATFAHCHLFLIPAVDPSLFLVCLREALFLFALTLLMLPDNDSSLSSFVHLSGWGSPYSSYFFWLLDLTLRKLVLHQLLFDSLSRWGEERGQSVGLPRKEQTDKETLISGESRGITEAVKGGQNRYTRQVMS